MLLSDDISSAVPGADTRQKPLLSRFSLCIFMVFSMLLLSACGNDRDENQPAELADISGTVFKGPTAGAIVTVFDEEGRQLGRGITDSKGRYSILFDRDYQGPVRIEALGGSYIDEASGEEKTIGVALQAVAVIKNNQQTVNITPVTHMAAKYVEAKGDLQSEAIDESNMITAGAFGVDGDIVETTPVDLTDGANTDVSGAKVDYALVIAGLTQIVQQNIAANNEDGDSIEEVMELFTRDLINGDQFNDTALLLQLNQGINDFIDSGNNQAQVSKEDTNTDSHFFRLKAQENFAFDQSVLNKTYTDQEFKAALKTGSGSGVIDFSSSDTNVATVDASTGSVTITGIGETIITARKAADNIYLQGTRSYTLMVAKAAQDSLSFQSTGPVAKTFGDDDFTNMLNGGSGTGTLSYSSSDTSIATVNSASGLITIVGVGSATITASKAADANFEPASANYGVTITKAIQGPLLFNAAGPVNKVFDAAAFTNVASGGTGVGAISYLSNNNSVATVNASTGAVAIIAVGSATITATKGTDSNYLAQSTMYIVNVAKAAQDPLNFQSPGPVAKTFGDGDFTNILSGGSGAGTLSYSSSDTSIATVNAASGLITIVSVGSATITASKAADANYLVASGQFNLNVAKAAQAALSFPLPLNAPVIKTFGGRDFSIVASGGTNAAPIVYSSSNPSIASVDAASGQVNMLGAGNIDISASKAGDALYAAVSASYRLEIGKSTQGAFFEIDVVNHSYGDAPFSNTLHHIADNGEPTYSSADTNVVTVNPNTGVVTIVGVGNTTVSGHIAANKNYLAASTSFTINIAKAIQQPLLFDTPEAQNKVFGDANFTNAASGGTGLGAISYASNDTSVATVDANTGTVSILAVGSAIITANKAGDNNYLAQSTESTVNVAKAAQEPLVFQSAESLSKTFSDGDFTNILSGGSGAGTLSYLSSDTSIATVNAASGLITIIGAGSATISVSKAADESYLENSGQFVLNVEKAPQATLDLGQPDILNHSYNGQLIISHTSGGSGSGELSASASTPMVDANIIEGAGLALSVLSTGSAVITVTKAADDNYLEAQASFTINVSKGMQTLSFADSGPIIKSHKDSAPFTNALSATGSGAEVYSSQDTNVATVNSNTGAVTVVGVGSTTINVSKASDELYLAANSSFELDVKVFVEPLYSNASNWNGYVKNDGSDVYNATNTACEGTESGGYTACIHGGEKRVVEVVGYNSCDFLSARDELNALRWQCDDSTNPVRFVSVGLQANKHLSDLLDFDSGTWLNNKVYVDYQDGSALTTHENVWWGNEVVINNDGGTLGNPGTIYLVNENTSASYKMTANNIGFVVKPGQLLSHDGSRNDMLYVEIAKFAWIEGSIFTASNSYPISMYQSNFSVLRNIDMRATHVSTLNIRMRSSDNNRLSNISIAGGSGGIELDSDSTDNTLSGIVLQGLSSSGVYVRTRNYLVDILAAASNNNILFLNGAKDVYVANMTIGHAGGSQPIYADSSANLLMSGLLVTGSSASRSALDLFFLHNSTLSDLAFDYIYNDTGFIKLDYANNNYFTGELRFGTGPATLCANGSATAGLADISCANTGSSDATLTQGIDLRNSFVGYAYTDDTRNNSDTSGTTSISSTVDWFNFDTPYRAWSRDLALLSISAPGRWDTGDGRITDWSLSTADNQVRGVRAAPANGNAANTITHTWSDNSTSTLLRNAVELLDDGIGNDNGMCESNEACLYTPNIGAYQGHDGKIQMTWSDGDTLTGITLYGYIQNGYASLID